jgi:hypothetical protein
MWTMVSSHICVTVNSADAPPPVRMLLKSGYRHVYISRSFAMRHRLISSKVRGDMLKA